MFFTICFLCVDLLLQDIHSSDFKVIARLKINILSWFTHCYVVPILYALISSMVHIIRCFEEQFWLPLYGQKDST